ncbi:MAG: hypothetical protein JF597_47820 [Streptomyces sp.]|nr:hypothetical protein [Streptomyces sp.]
MAWMNPDGQLDDPAGQGVEAARLILDAIETRVRELISEMAPADGQVTTARRRDGAIPLTTMAAHPPARDLHRPWHPSHLNRPALGAPAPDRAHEPLPELGPTPRAARSPSRAADASRSAPDRTPARLEALLNGSRRIRGPGISRLAEPPGCGS